MCAPVKGKAEQRQEKFRTDDVISTEISSMVIG